MKKILLTSTSFVLAIGLFSIPAASSPASVSSWQTNPVSGGWSGTTANFLPPASNFGYGAWDDDNTLYKLKYEFFVTGISGGIGK